MDRIAFIKTGLRYVRATRAQVEVVQERAAPAAWAQVVVAVAPAARAQVVVTVAPAAWVQGVVREVRAACAIRLTFANRKDTVRVGIATVRSGCFVQHKGFVSNKQRVKRARKSAREEYASKIAHLPVRAVSVDQSAHVRAAVALETGFVTLVESALIASAENQRRNLVQ